MRKDVSFRQLAKEKSQSIISGGSRLIIGTPKEHI